MADVASNMYDWSVTAGSNAPLGTALIGAGLDDNLREIQAVTRAWLAHKGADIASATTTDIGAVSGVTNDITGTTTITGLGTVSAGIWKRLKFEGALTLTHNATSLILPGASNITTADGLVCTFASEGSGNWRMVGSNKAVALHSTVVCETDTTIGANTSDGSDNLVLSIRGGGTSGLSASRGAIIQVGGNESSFPGQAVIAAGTGGKVFLNGQGTYVNVMAAGVYIGDDANAGNAAGLTINQGAADDEVLSFKSSDVDHGVTTVAETDTYAAFKKVTAASGGLQIDGISEGAQAFQLRGIPTSASTGKTTAATAAVQIDGALVSGTGVASLGANANILAVRDNGTTRFILDADGDSHQDVGTAWTNFDHLPDVETLNAIAYNVARDDDPIKQKFGQWMADKRDVLVDQKLVTFGEDGRPFVNMSKLSMLLVGAVRQESEKVAELEKLVKRQGQLIERLEKALPSSL